MQAISRKFPRAGDLHFGKQCCCLLLPTKFPVLYVPLIGPFLSIFLHLSPSPRSLILSQRRTEAGSIMDASILCRLVLDVALLGGELSTILQNYASLCDSRVDSDLKNLLVHLNSTSHTLNQLGNLLSPTRVAEQQGSLFTNEGLKYVEALTEECSVAFDRVKLIFTSEGTVDSCTYKYWKSPIETDNKGHRVFPIPVLDEAQIFRKIKVTKSWRLFPKLEGPADRLEHLQALLLLVIQVVTVQDLTTKL
jgi:hypothetical protein